MSYLLFLHSSTVSQDPPGLGGCEMGMSVTSYGACYLKGQGPGLVNVRAHAIFCVGAVAQVDQFMRVQFSWREMTISAWEIGFGLCGVIKVACSLYSAVRISDIQPRDFLRLCMQVDGVETCLHASDGRR